VVETGYCRRLWGWDPVDGLEGAKIYKNPGLEQLRSTPKKGEGSYLGGDNLTHTRLEAFHSNRVQRHNYIRLGDKVLIYIRRWNWMGFSHKERQKTAPSGRGTARDSK